MNRSEIYSNIMRELLGLKWVGNTTRQLTPPPPLKKKKKRKKREPQVGRGLFGVHLLILHFEFHQFSKSIKSSTFQIFLNLTYPFRKISLSQNTQKSPKDLHKTAKQRDLALLET